MTATNALPIPSPSSAETPSLPQDDVPPRILIVDDVADNRTILTRRFERRGFAITEADCGEAALRLIAEHDFDLVLLDVMMPDIDGVEVLRQIRSDARSRSLPVIMVTARAMSEDIVQALQLGADDYITKPVDFTVAIARVNTQIARRRAERQVLRAAEEVHRSNQVLEERVRERTSQLLRINEQLKNEIRQRERSEAETKFLAHHDALTGLVNRVLFRERLGNAVRELKGGAVAVLFIDLDGFKNVNDMMGHAVGDQLLREIAFRLRSAVPNGACVARLGGDEFAVLIDSCPNTGMATELAETIVKRVSELVRVGDSDVTVGASVGIAFAENGDADLDEVLRNADLAMYRAKSDEPGSWRVYDREMDAIAEARRQLELDLRRALAVGDFRLYFQPIINVNTMKVVTLEALLRWDHATRGIVSPAEFISVAEDTGLIVPLGDWAIREACRHAATWPDDVSVAVNLSPVQFSRGNIVPTIVSALASSGLRPDRFEIEITESIIFDQSERNLGILNQLRDLGVRVSMDDFGTGYSGLSFLRTFRFDKIKIDKSFINDQSNNENSRAIISAIAGLSSRFGMYTTVEGVENAEQFKFASNEGCTEVQGYMFSRPVPAAEVPTLLQRLGS